MITQDTLSLAGPETLPLILDVIRTVVAVVGVPFLGLQLWRQTKAQRLQSETTRLSLYDQVMKEASALNQKLITEPDLADFYEAPTEEPPTNWDEMKPKQRKHYMFLGLHLSYLERSYVLGEAGWLDQDDAGAIRHHLREIVSLGAFPRWWGALRPYYRADFAASVDKERALLLAGKAPALPKSENAQ